MKQIILSIVIILSAIVATSQIGLPIQSARCQADNWNTCLSDKPHQIMIVASLTAAQSKPGFQSIKLTIAKPGEKKLQEIKYWYAGLLPTSANLLKIW